MKRVLVLVLVLVLSSSLALVGACAPSRGAAYEKSVAEARRAYGAGHFDDAAARWAQASKEAKLPRDAIYARYESALASARAGDNARAARELSAIADGKNAYSAEAAYRVAELRMATDLEDGYRQLEGVVVRFPASGVAQVALVHIARHDDETGGSDKALAHLEALASRLQGTGVEPTLAYERAKRLAALGRTEAARAAYLAIAEKWPYPFGAYFDDALFHASEMDEKLGRYEDAIADLERLLDHRETSSFMGTYERPKYVPAILRIAALAEDKLHDRARARAALHRLYEDFTTSPLRDDALWREAELYRQDGDAGKACDRLATLAGDFPDSRYVPCAMARCPAIKRPSKSKAPTSCHGYIERGEGSSRPEAPPAEETPRQAPREAPKKVD